MTRLFAWLAMLLHCNAPVVLCYRSEADPTCFASKAELCQRVGPGFRGGCLCTAPDWFTVTCHPEW